MQNLYYIFQFYFRVLGPYQRGIQSAGGILKLCIVTTCRACSVVDITLSGTSRSSKKLTAAFVEEVHCTQAEGYMEGGRCALATTQA